MCTRAARSVCEFNHLAVGFWWMLAHLLDPIEKLDDEEVRGQSHSCLYDYDDYLSISGEKRNLSDSDSDRYS